MQPVKISLRLLRFGSMLRFCAGLGVLAISHGAVFAADGGEGFLPHVARRVAMAESLRVVAFGSSSTEGIGATSKQFCYPSQLQAILSAKLRAPVVVINRGVGGEDVDDMMLRLSAVIDENPDLVIWQTGSNDALRAVAVEHFIADTREGILRMRSAGIDVMLMEPQLSERLRQTEHPDAFRAAVRALGQEMGVPVIRRYDMMQQWLASGQLTYQQMMSGDRLHMTDGGYQRLAQAVADIIISDAAMTPEAVRSDRQAVAHQATSSH
jgi:lysophospholipase L1-like esterase